MTELLNPLLTLLINYGYPIIIITILIGYMGVPIPSEALLLAAGSFAADGTFDIYITISLVIITALTGDTIIYLLGKKFGYVLSSKIGISVNKFKKVESFLDKWGIWCVFITRWLLTPLSLPVNLVAGTSRYSFRKFIISAAFGEALWAIAYIYLGFIFGANWQSLLDYISDAPLLILFVVLGITTLILGLRSFHQKSFFK
jgi:membrane-associated protein